MTEMRLLRLFRRQEGISLVMAIGILSVLSLAGSALVAYSSANARNADFSKGNASAYDLAEAGINEMAAVLSNPKNNALRKTLLPETTKTYDGGTVTWSGTLDEFTGRWTLTSVGKVRNPTGPGATDVTRTVKAEVRVTQTLTQPANNPAWNYVYSRGTGQTCDTTPGNTVNITSPLYVEGNLCLRNEARVSGGPLNVHGAVRLYNELTSVGSSANPIETRIGRGCEAPGKALASPCPTDGSYRIWGNAATAATPETIPSPAPDWDGWYLNANPGPTFPCLVSSGTPPVFENELLAATRNNSVPAVQDLTPTSSYTCQTAVGELSWNSVTRVLTVKGTIYIDGSAKIENGVVNSYSGASTLYLSGTLLIKNSKMCAMVGADGNCTMTGWNPNERMLVVAANGSGGQVPADTSIQLVSSHFQGALYGTKAIDIGTTSMADGPLNGAPVKLGQASSSSFPGFTMMPAGAPGNPAVYAEVGAPEKYRG